MGLSTVLMPAGYFAMGDAPDVSKVDSIIQEALPKLMDTGEKIKYNQLLEFEKNGAFFKGRIINPLFYRFYISTKGFYTTDKCITCNQCVKLCPLNNIKMINGRPKWEDTCTHCMACISACPTEAIEYKDKTAGLP